MAGKLWEQWEQWEVVVPSRGGRYGTEVGHIGEFLRDVFVCCHCCVSVRVV